MSDIADFKGAPHSLKDIAFRDELMPDIAVVSQCGYRLHDAAIVEFLVVVKVAPARVASGVEMSNPLDVPLDGADNVALHDLHVVDVVEEFDARRINALANFNAPPSSVSLIVFVVNFAVEEFEGEGNSCFLGSLGNSLQALNSVFQTFLVADAPAVAGEANQDFDAILLCQF